MFKYLRTDLKIVEDTRTVEASDGVGKRARGEGGGVWQNREIRTSLLIDLLKKINGP